MNRLYRTLQRKFGRYAIKNLVLYIMITYAIGYFMMLVFPEAYDALLLYPSLVMKGQVWRLFSWIFTVPQSFDAFLVFMFIFYYWIGQRLEAIWGSFGYNLYIFSGLLFMTLGSMIIYWITGYDASPGTYYINLASFLAFAFYFPDTKVYLFFVIPFKVKWIAIVDLICMAYEFVSARAVWRLYMEAGYTKLANNYLFSVRLQIIASILNFVIFYLMVKDFRRFSPKEIKRKQKFKRETTATIRPSVTKHKCAVCGKSEKDGENLTFRFCSKCNGNYEFCEEHLYTHKHFE